MNITAQSFGQNAGAGMLGLAAMSIVPSSPVAALQSTWPIRSNDVSPKSA